LFVKRLMIFAPGKVKTLKLKHSLTKVGNVR